MNKVTVFSDQRRFSGIARAVRGKAKRLMALTGRKDSLLEIFLVGKSFMDKNVLAFKAPKSLPRPDIKAVALGEIYLNPVYIKKHGENLVYMLIHGYLHLLDYDHKRKVDTMRMEQKEKELLKEISN